MPKKCFTLSTALRLMAFLAVALVFVERPLQAYADPGSGLFMWQLLGAIVIGAGYQARRLVQKLKNLSAPGAVPAHQSSSNSREPGTQESGNGILLS